MIKRFLMIALALVVCVAVGSEGVAVAAKYRSTAQLHGQSGLKAKVNFDYKSQNGKAYKRLQVKASNGMPLKNYGVYVNGKKVGNFTANMAGKGKLDLRAGYKQSGSSKKMPKWFSKLKKGDLVEVGTNCGIAYNCDQSGTQKYKLEGEAFGDSGEQVNVTYCEKFVNETLDRRFIVDLANAPIDFSYDVYCDGIFVGTVIVDEFGTGKIELRTAEFIPEGSTAQPMGDDFPTLAPGSECSVGGIIVALTEVTGCNYIPDNGDDDSSSDDESSDDDSSDDDNGSGNGSGGDDDSSD